MIFIVRHGQTELNKRNLLQGRSDYPLNDIGMRQAEDAASWFKEKGIVFDRVYSSPLKRALQTAEILTGGRAPVIADERLLEMDYGKYEGIGLGSIPPELTAFFHDFAGTPAPETMEQLSEVVARLGSFLEERKEELSCGNVLISTHAIAMKGALEYLTPDSKGSYWARFIGNCSVFSFTVENGRYSVPEEIYCEKD